MRHFLTWAESAARLNSDDEGLRQVLELGGWRDLRAYVRASDRGFLATLSGEGVALSEGNHGIPLYSRWDSNDPTYLKDGRTLNAWGDSDDFCEWEKQETSSGVTGYAAVYLLYGFLRAMPWCVKTAAQQGRVGGIEVTPPGWWDRDHSPIPLHENGEPMTRFALLDRGEKTGYRRPPEQLQELWFQVDDIERMAAGTLQSPTAHGHVKESREMERVSSAKNSGKPLDSREKATLLSIIGALADAAKLDLSKHHKAGEAIAAMLDTKGVRLSARTIGIHLKEVREAMDSRKR